MSRTKDYRALNFSRRLMDACGARERTELALQHTRTAAHDGAVGQVAYEAWQAALMADPAFCFAREVYEEGDEPIVAAETGYLTATHARDAARVALEVAEQQVMLWQRMIDAAHEGGA